MAQRSSSPHPIRNTLLALTALDLIGLGLFMAHHRVQDVSNDASGWRKTRFIVVSRSAHAVEPGSNLAHMRLRFFDEHGTPAFVETNLQWDQPSSFQAWIQHSSVFQADSPPQPFSWLDKVGVYFLAPFITLMVGAVVIAILGLTVYHEVSEALKKKKQRKAVRV